MNGEEKILAILEQMQGDISDLKQGQTRLEGGQVRLEGQMDKLEGRMDKLEDRMDKLEDGQSALQQDVERIKNSIVNIELTEMPKIAAALEGFEFHDSAIRRQDLRILNLEHLTDRHTIEIAGLKKG